jgi:hypothetical protein
VTNEDCRAEARFRRAKAGLSRVTGIAPNYDSASQSENQNRMGFSYLYILQSQTDGERVYTGLTDNLQGWLRKHNAGEVWPEFCIIVCHERKRAQIQF